VADEARAHEAGAEEGDGGHCGLLVELRDRRMPHADYASRSTASLTWRGRARERVMV